MQLFSRRSLSVAVFVAGFSILAGTVTTAVAFRWARAGSIGVAVNPPPEPEEPAIESSVKPGHSPKAVVDRTPVELGMIEVSDEFDHTFVIRNEGGAPLELKHLPTGCKCTVVGMEGVPVPPGGEGRVRVGLKDPGHSGPLKTGLLDRGITLLTNDPDKEKLLVGMTATVVRRLAFEPQAIVFSSIDALNASEAARTAEVVLYSQTWDRFDLGGAVSSRSGMKWKIEPAPKERLKELEAKSGYRVEITLPPDMPEGAFFGIARSVGQAGQSGRIGPFGPPGDPGLRGGAGEFRGREGLRRPHRVPRLAEGRPSRTP